MIDGYTAYRMYVGLKNHFFTKAYDYWKYNKKVNISKENFNQRNDQSLFHVIGKTFYSNRDLENYYIANFKQGVKYVGDLVKDSRCKDNFRKHISVIDSLMYHIKKEIEKVKENNSDNKYITSGRLFKDYTRDEILLETLCLFDIFFDIFKYYDSNLNMTLYQDKENRNFIDKYRTYMANTIDKNILASIKTLYYNNFIF